METRSRDGGTSAGSGKCRPDSPIRFLCRWIPVLTALALLIGAAARLRHLEPCIYVYCACILAIPVLYLVMVFIFRRWGPVVSVKAFLLITIMSLFLTVSALFAGWEAEQRCSSSHEWIWFERQ